MEKGIGEDFHFVTRHYDMPRQEWQFRRVGGSAVLAGGLSTAMLPTGDDIRWGDCKRMVPCGSRASVLKTTTTIGGGGGGARTTASFPHLLDHDGQASLRRAAAELKIANLKPHTCDFLETVFSVLAPTFPEAVRRARFDFSLALDRVPWRPWVPRCETMAMLGGKPKRQADGKWQRWSPCHVHRNSKKMGKPHATIIDGSM